MCNNHKMTYMYMYTLIDHVTGSGKYTYVHTIHRSTNNI